MTPKMKLTMKQMLNLSTGTLGVQFAFSLAIANTSGIFAFLGTSNNKLGYLWLLPSIIGLVLPPFIGYFSDKTYSSLGKRMPYVLTGAAISAIAMICLPNSFNIATASLLLFILMSAVNIALQPLRPLIADVVPASQHTKAYAIQAAMIGIGAILASTSTWLFLHLLPLHTAPGKVPYEIRYAFYVGAIVIVASNLWTTITMRKQLSQIRDNVEQTKTTKQSYKTKVLQSLKYLHHMPKLMRQISYVQIFTWLGTFSFIIYFTPTIEETIYHISPFVHAIHGALYKHEVEKSTILTGLACGAYMLFNVLFAYFIPYLSTKIGRKNIHIIALFFGGISLISITLMHNYSYLLLAMIGIGITWASFNSIPFAMVASVTPDEQMGLTMGVFNIAICLPQIIVSAFVGILLKEFFHNDPIYVLIAAGISFIIAAMLMIPIKDNLP